MDVSFEIRLTRLPRYTEKGWDEIEFQISTNPGEPVKPLGRVVSGGELSRIMLAIKTILADRDAVETLIFDEIDTGISGRDRPEGVGKNGSDRKKAPGNLHYPPGPDRGYGG